MGQDTCSVDAVQHIFSPEILIFETLHAIEIIENDVHIVAMHEIFGDVQYMSAAMPKHLD